MKIRPILDKKLYPESKALWIEKDKNTGAILSVVRGSLSEREIDEIGYENYVAKEIAKRKILNLHLFELSFFWYTGYCRFPKGYLKKSRSLHPSNRRGILTAIPYDISYLEEDEEGVVFGIDNMHFGVREEEKIYPDYMLMDLKLLAAYLKEAAFFEKLLFKQRSEKKRNEVNLSLNNLVVEKNKGLIDALLTMRSGMNEILMRNGVIENSPLEP